LQISLGTIVGAFASEFANVYILSKLKILMTGRLFWVRSLTSTAIGEFVLLLISMAIGFYGHASAKELTHLLFSAYIFELIFTIIAVFPLTLLVRFLKKSEEVDVYDYNTDFNPFSLNK
ncbi:MAG: VUT family protein, partial [Gammaproteobacteria bacterium]